MEKTPQTQSMIHSTVGGMVGGVVQGLGRGKNKHRGWQRRYFVLTRTSHVRCVLAYFKSEAASHDFSAAKGRLVLVPTATVRRVGRDLFCVDSDQVQSMN